MRMNTSIELVPSTGLDEVPAALPTGFAGIVAVWIPPGWFSQPVSIAQHNKECVEFINQITQVWLPVEFAIHSLLDGCTQNYQTTVPIK